MAVQGLINWSDGLCCVCVCVCCCAHLDVSHWAKCRYDGWLDGAVWGEVTVSGSLMGQLWPCLSILDRTLNWYIPGSGDAQTVTCTGAKTSFKHNLIRSSEIVRRFSSHFLDILILFSFFKGLLSIDLLLFCHTLAQIMANRSRVPSILGLLTKSGSKLWNWPLKTGSIVKPPTCSWEKEDRVSGKRTLPGGR